MSYPWEHTRRFNAYSNYIKKIFGTRVQKVSIDAGFTCPNRDGTIARGGCIYCDNRAFNPSYCNAEKPVKQQIREGIEFHEKRYRTAGRYLAYFQAYSNTYADIETLKDIYNEALEVEEVAGLVIGTRPDCIDEYKLDYFRELSERMYVIIEYGIESCNNHTLRSINRGHTFEQAFEALELTRKMGVRSGAHFIFGLPGETREEMLRSSGIISELPIDNIKFHQLQIIKNTLMAKEFREHPGRFELFSLEEYIDFISAFLARMNPRIVVERIAGEAPPRFIDGKYWGMRYDNILRLLEDKMLEKDLWQGKYYNKQ